MLEAAELLRASASDSDAVQQYLRTIDSDELDHLLDAFAATERRKKEALGAAPSAATANEQDWRALVHLLLRADASRQRTATRIIQLLWRGHTSELEAMQWLTEISLGFVAVSHDREFFSASCRARVDREVRVILQVVFEFLRDLLPQPREIKMLPQLLGMVPLFLGILVDVAMPTADAGVGAVDVVNDHMVQFLELPWNARTMPSLLELLRENSSLVSERGWTQLRECVQNQLTSSASIPSDSRNALFRECMLLSSVTGDPIWINISRSLLRTLPCHLRQEAEFTMQMSFHMSRRVIALTCEAIRSSVLREPCESATEASDWTDVLFLLHALRASKPVLHHHHVSRGGPIVKDALFLDIECILRELLLPSAEGTSVDRETRCCNTASSEEIDKYVQQRIELVLTFGGHHVFSRKWKAQYLSSFSRYWMTQSSSCEGDLACSLARSVVLSIYHQASEVREEILQYLLDEAKLADHAEVNLKLLEQIVRQQPAGVVSHVALIQDWLSAMVHIRVEMVPICLRVVAPLLPLHRDFYNFVMVFLRKLLSFADHHHHQLTMEVLCAWLEDHIQLDAGQEEEVISAIKTAIQLLPELRSWSFDRLHMMFAGSTNNSRILMLRPSSWKSLHHLVTSELFELVKPISLMRCGDDDSDSGFDDDDDDTPLEHFELCLPVGHGGSGTSLHTALQWGEVLESLVECVLALERAARLDGSSPDSERFILGPELSRSLVRWVTAFVSNWDVFFSWVATGKRSCHDSSDVIGSDECFARELGVRVGLGRAMANVALTALLCQGGASQPNESEVSTLWKLCEIQLCLQRLWRRYLSTCSLRLTQKTDSFSTSKRGFKTLNPHLPRLLAGVLSGFEAAIEQTVDISSPSGQGMSLDAATFVLDVYTNGGGKRPSSTARQDVSASSILEELSTLLKIYKAIHSCSRISGQKLAPNVAHAPVFTTYADSIASKLPKSMRHLVCVESSGSVALDTAAQEELLSRVCSGIHLLVKVAAKRDIPISAAMTTHMPHPNHTSAMIGTVALFVQDVRDCLETEGLTKFKMVAAGLCKHLFDRCTGSSEDAGSNEDIAHISRTTFRLLCEHVVHHLPLLRALLSLCFSTAAIQRQDDVYVEEVLDWVDAILQVCMPRVKATAKKVARRSKATPTAADSDVTEHLTKRRRKRIRQSKEDHAHSDSDSGSESHAKLLPLLVSDGAQAIALQSTLPLLELFQSQLATRIQSRSAQCQDLDSSIRRFVRANNLVATSVFTTCDLAWISARSLVKLLGMVDTAIRLGKSATAARMLKDDTKSLDKLLDVFESSVVFTLRGRAWVNMVREAAHHGSKAKISATILKADIFLLEIPALVEALMKLERADASIKARIRAFATSVEQELTPVTAQTSPHKKSTKSRVIGVVPVVKSRRKRLRSRNPFIDAWLGDEDGDDAYADLEDFIE